MTSASTGLGDGRAGPGRERFHDAVVETLGRRIVGGALTFGASIGTEQDLSAEFGTSRTVIREAVKILSAKGIIDSRPRSGTRVTHPSSWHLLDPQVLAWRLGSRNQAEQASADLYELRASFEPTAAELAADRSSPQDLQRMKHALLGMALASTIEEKIEHDLAFHNAILAATGNVLFQAFGALISAALRHIFHVGLERTPADDERWIKWHQDVYEAIASGQTDAARRQMIKLLNEGQEVQKLHRDRSKRGAMPE